MGGMYTEKRCSLCKKVVKASGLRQHYKDAHDAHHVVFLNDSVYEPEIKSFMRTVPMTNPTNDNTIDEGKAAWNTLLQLANPLVVAKFNNTIVDALRSTQHLGEDHTSEHLFSAAVIVMSSVVANIWEMDPNMSKLLYDAFTYAYTHNEDREKGIDKLMKSDPSIQKVEPEDADYDIDARVIEINSEADIQKLPKKLRGVVRHIIEDVMAARGEEDNPFPHPRKPKYDA